MKKLIVLFFLCTVTLSMQSGYPKRHGASRSAMPVNESEIIIQNVVENQERYENAIAATVVLSIFFSCLEMYRYENGWPLLYFIPAAIALGVLDTACKQNSSRLKRLKPADIEAFIDNHKQELPRETMLWLRDHKCFSS